MDRATDIYTNIETLLTEIVGHDELLNASDKVESNSFIIPSGKLVSLVIALILGLILTTPYGIDIATRFNQPRGQLKNSEPGDDHRNSNRLKTSNIEANSSLPAEAQVQAFAVQLSPAEAHREVDVAHQKPRSSSTPSIIIDRISGKPLEEAIAEDRLATKRLNDAQLITAGGDKS